MYKGNIKLFLLFFLFVTVFFRAQQNSDFEILLDKAVKMTYENPEEGINFSQGLLLNEKNSAHQLIIKHLISQAQSMKGDYLQSVKVSLEKTNQERTKDSYFSQIYLDYSLAEQYQNLGLYNQSSKIIEKVLPTLIETKSNDKSLQITIAKLYQLQAINFGILKKYDKLKENIANSNRFLTIADHENQIIGLENQIFLAIASLNQNDTKIANNQIDHVLKKLESHPDYNFLFALASVTKARIYFSENNYNSAIISLQEAFLRIENLGYLPLESKIYEELAKNYFALNDMPQSQKYQNLYSDTTSKIEGNKKDGISYIVNLLENYEAKNLEYHAEVGRKSIVKWSSIILAILLVILFYFIFEVYRGKNLEKQLLFFEKFSKNAPHPPSLNMENNNVEIEEEHEEIIKPEVKEIKKTVSISKEKEIDIIRKLDELEKSDRFLKKTMSLATLAGQLETNTKYLSEIINKYKGKNYNTYINELRVNHIAYLLKTDPAYLNYKVSYLADISGFSSHSSFATIFKSITGMSPNTYIQQINKSNK